MLKFATRYKLKRDTPTHNAGAELRWEGMDQRFYFLEAKTNPLDLTRSDRNGPSFTVNQVQDGAWFKPLTALRPFIPKFPSRRKIEEYVTLDASCRMVDSVDECRAISALINDKNFQQHLYEFYREEYNEFHGL